MKAISPGFGGAEGWTRLNPDEAQFREEAGEKGLRVLVSGDMLQRDVSKGGCCCLSGFSHWIGAKYIVGLEMSRDGCGLAVRV